MRMAALCLLVVVTGCQAGTPGERRQSRRAQAVVQARLVQSGAEFRADRLNPDAGACAGLTLDFRPEALTPEMVPLDPPARIGLEPDQHPLDWRGPVVPEPLSDSTDP